MQEESQKTVEYFDFKRITPTNSALPYELFEQKIHGNEVFLCNAGIDSKFNVNAVGTVPAALTVYELAAKLNVELVINPGTAGGFNSRGGNIGDIYLASKVLFHHREIPMGPYEPYGIGTFDAYDFNQLDQSLNFKTGVFSSSDSLTCREHEIEFFNQHQVIVKEMEAGAIAYVCEQLKIPYLGVKSITDIVDGGRVTADEFLENLETASKNLQQFLTTLLKSF